MNSHIDAVAQAEKRQTLWRGYEPVGIERRNWLDPNHEHTVGLLAEVEFGDAYGLLVDLTPRPGGDRHTQDFDTPLGKVGVKGSGNYTGLWVPERDWKGPAVAFIAVAVNKPSRSAQ